ncbi:UNVERIFIED_CONTAM: hypothetical protein GTU68_026373 [Idotea baltica]
MRIQL